MSEYYLLVDKKIVPVDNLLEWAKGFEEGSRIVTQEYVGDQWISTVFLGIDHQWGKGKPVLFETMIFSREDDAFEYFQTRSCTYSEANLMHEFARIEVLDYYLVEKSMAIIRAGALAILTIILIYLIL